MSDFRAKIKAVLDVSDFQNQLKSIGGNSKITLSNFSVDTSKIISDIQSALSKSKFNINIDTSGKSGNFGSNITSQMKQISTNVGKSFSASLSSSLNNISIKNGNIGNVKSVLSSAGFDSKSVGVATKGLEEMLVTVNKIQTTISKNGNIRMSIDGIDEIGRAVTVVRELDAKTGKPYETLRKFSQTFGESATAAKKFADDVSKANSAISSNSMDASIAKVVAQYEKLSTSGHESLASVQRDIENLKTAQASVSASSIAGDNQALVANYNNFNATLERVKNNLSTIKFETAETSTSMNKLNASARDAGTALKTGYVESSVAKMKLQYEQLATTGHSKLTEVSSDIQKLSSLQNEMANTSDATKLAKTYDEFNMTLLKVKNNLSTIKSESGATVSALQISTLDNKISLWFEKNSKASKDFGSNIENLRTRLSQLTAGTSTISDLNEIENEFKQLQQAAIATGKTGKSIGDTLKGAFSSLTKYLSVSTIIYQAVNAMKQMYATVKEIDSSMTELKKVTNESESTYKAFAKNAGTASKQIGTTISDYITSTADFARLGYSFEDSQQLAKAANIYAVVGDEIKSTEDATKSLISTMAAFKSEMKAGETNGDFAMDIIDKFNEVSNNYAISSGGIGEALERSASSLKAAGNTIDESIALITAANTVVQDPDVIGTGFKTISMRIRGAKSELESAGLETEGMVESTAKLRQEIEALSGVDIMLDDSTFKSTYQILEELSDKWQDLTDIQQAKTCLNVQKCA